MINVKKMNLFSHCINGSKRLFFIIILSFSLNCFSQTDSLFKSIATYQDTTAILISNARNLTISKFKNHDKKAILGLKEFLQKIENNEYISLYPIERWLLDYYVNDYNDILITVIKFDSAYYSSFNYKKRPYYDLLEMKLENYLKENYISLFNNIDSSLVSQEEKDFLKLNLQYLLKVSNSMIYSNNDTLNLNANNFISSFPWSCYIPYIKKYIRYEFAPSNGGLAFNLGFGIRMNSGNIKNTIDEGILINFGIGIPYKKWDYDLRILVGPVQLQKDLQVKGVTWNKGNDANYLNCEFSVGRNILESKKHRLSPSLGIAITEFSPYKNSIDNNPKIKDVFVDIGNIIWGINYQYKYPIFKCRDPFFHFFGCLNLRYALSWQPSSNKLYQGFVHYVTFSWGFEIRGNKKIE